MSKKYLSTLSAFKKFQKHFETPCMSLTSKPVNEEKKELKCPHCSNLIDSKSIWCSICWGSVGSAKNENI